MIPSLIEFDLMAEPRGKVYDRLLATLSTEFPTFSLMYRRLVHPSASIDLIAARLSPYALRSERVTEWPGTQFAAKPDDPHLPELVMYTVTDESLRLLAEARGLYQWKEPRRPEDLAFYDADGRYWLGSVAHERIGRLRVPADFVPFIRAVRNLRTRPVAESELLSPGG